MLWSFMLLIHEFEVNLTDFSTLMRNFPEVLNMNHVVIFRLFFMNLRRMSQILLKWWLICLNSWLHLRLDAIKRCEGQYVQHGVQISHFSHLLGSAILIGAYYMGLWLEVQAKSFIVGYPDFGFYEEGQTTLNTIVAHKIVLVWISKRNTNYALYSPFSG
jgi:hypothetical protein